MLSLEEDVEAQALREQGWSISAIARHLKRDRKTIRRYLAGEVVPGRRRRSAVDPFEPFVAYCRARLVDDPHLWASTLLDEITELGYGGGYSTFTRALRRHRLRPHCEPCQATRGRDVAIITHPAGEETQWDWVELPDPPAAWGLGRHAHLLVGALAHSGRWRAVLAESEDFPHLVEALDAVVRKLGGVTRVWRFDRMATVCSPGSGRITAVFAQVAKHYGVRSVVCPPRRGNRKGVVEKANHSAAQRWWRTLADDVTLAAAQAGVDRLAGKLDGRRRVRDGQRTTVAELAAGEQLRMAPTAAFPAEFDVPRVVTPQALVAFRGNAYSVPPGLAGAQVQVRHRLGADSLRIVTARGATVAVHRRAVDGAGLVVRDEGHVVALERAVLAGSSTDRPCTHKTRRPPSAVALAEAAKLRGLPATGPAAHVVIDLSTYAATAARLHTAPTYEDEE
ncbi:IS21 family transposase [Saccharothrix sp.]|uniref:IS21 family transposase n=1 Tax=Saccharothrix sp. TaxID=1873460 RepID=UPI0028116F08|nr:IS21 family transposase [Saccharothrix sp.]